MRKPEFVSFAAALVASVCAQAEERADDELRPPAPFIRESTFNQEPGEGKLQGKLLRVKRPLLIVTDLERALDFYVDVIGLEVYAIEPTYNRDPASLGYEMFNIPPGSRKRMAMLNTSDEVRGLTLQEVRDFDFEFDHTPRAFTVLFETDDLLGIRKRAAAAGFPIIEPAIAEIPATDSAPLLRFAEFGIVDPDGHVVAFYQSFRTEAEWQKALKTYAELE